MTASDLREVLRRGFFVDILREVGERCTECDEVARYPAALLVLEHVCTSIVQRWEDRAVHPDEVDAGRSALESHMVSLLNALDANDQSGVAERGNNLASAFLDWRAL